MNANENDVRLSLDDLAVSCGAASMVSCMTHPNGPRTSVKFSISDGSLERFAAALAQRTGSGDYTQNDCGCAPNEACDVCHGRPPQPDSGRDAARYQWLRSDDIGVPSGQREISVYLERLPFREDQSDELLTGKELDSAIDAAMAAQQGEKGGA